VARGVRRLTLVQPADMPDGGCDGADSVLIMDERGAQAAGRPANARAAAPMNAIHVVTVADDLPIDIFDKVMTSTEQALLDLGATKVWVDPNLPAHAVMAEIHDRNGLSTHSADARGRQPSGSSTK
jgi:hypothetical protein